MTYNESKDKELNKGLDLKGGINVILQVSVKDILRGLSNNSKDPAFNQALANADEAQKMLKTIISIYFLKHLMTFQMQD